MMAQQHDEQLDRAVIQDVNTTEPISLPPGDANKALIWNDDGTDLTDLAGFKVRYGPAVDNYTNVDTINDPTATTYLVENLAPGTWFFEVTAFNTSENESVFSNYVSKVVSVP